MTLTSCNNKKLEELDKKVEFRWEVVVDNITKYKSEVKNFLILCDKIENKNNKMFKQINKHFEKIKTLELKYKDISEDKQNEYLDGYYQLEKYIYDFMREIDRKYHYNKTTLLPEEYLDYEISLEHLSYKTGLSIKEYNDEISSFNIEVKNPKKKKPYYTKMID